MPGAAIVTERSWLQWEISTTRAFHNCCRQTKAFKTIFASWLFSRSTIHRTTAACAQSYLGTECLRYYSVSGSTLIWWLCALQKALQRGSAWIDYKTAQGLNLGTREFKKGFFPSIRHLGVFGSNNPEHSDAMEQSLLFELQLFA